MPQKLQNSEPGRGSSRSSSRRPRRATGGGRKSGEKKSPAGLPSYEEQKAAFELGVEAYNAGKPTEAVKHFEAATKGPDAQLAHAARTRRNICLQRLATQQVQLQTASDYYNYGILQMNANNLPEAIEHLEKALHMEPDGAHIHYALALAFGLNGNLDRAANHLERAIQLDPWERIHALNDADFASLRAHPEIRKLLRADSSED